MPPDSQPDNSTKIVLIIVGGVVAVVLVIALACGGLFYFTTRTLFKTVDKTMEKVAEEVEKSRLSMEAANAAEAFLSDLSLGQVERAYGNTTRNYQGRQKLGDLRAYVDQHPVLKRHANFRQPMMPLPPVVNDRVTLRMTLDGNQAQIITLDMVKEDGLWKVDEVVAP